MNILILYASTEGQTRKIAAFCLKRLTSAGHGAAMLRASDAGEIDAAAFDAVIVAGSVHLGRIQSELRDAVAGQAAALSRRPGLFLVVSLAAAGDDAEELADLDAIARRFQTDTGWTPSATHHVAGAFRFGEYDFFKRWAMRYIAMKKGQEVPDPHGDLELTDWDALGGLLDDWTQKVRENA